MVVEEAYGLWCALCRVAWSSACRSVARKRYVHEVSTGESSSSTLSRMARLDKASRGYKCGSFLVEPCSIHAAYGATVCHDRPLRVHNHLSGGIISHNIFWPTGIEPQANHCGLSLLTNNSKNGRLVVCNSSPQRAGPILPSDLQSQQQSPAAKTAITTTTASL